MKVKFTKLAALLLAGVALFATGCTDYEVDIQKVDQKVDNLTSDVNNKIASLEQQIAGINATIATLETQAKHDEDIQKLNKTITDLETALKADYEKKINDAVAALNAAIDTKVDKTVFEAAKEALTQALTEANAKIQALEQADENFKKQIADLTKQFTDALGVLDGKIAKLQDEKADKEQVAKDIAAAKADLEKKITDLETAVNGELTTLKDRMDKAEAAINKINTETIPALQAQIDKINNETIPALKKEIQDKLDGKLDKVTFEEYKTATAGTIKLMQDAIKALEDLTAGFGDKTIKKYIDDALAEVNAKFDDYVLKTTFDAFVKIAATKEELNALEARINGQLEQLEKDLKKYADDQDAKLKEELTKYINGEIKKLQDQIDVINEKITALDTRLTTLEGTVAKVVDALEFCVKEDEDGNAYYDLQGYIDNADQLLQDQIDEIWTWIDEYLIPTLNEIFEDIYTQLELLNERVIEALQRIQSIQFVPDYDDLKITSNMSFISGNVEIVDEETGEGTNEYEPLTIAFDQPTKVTYQFLPAQYAQDVADGVEEFVTNAAYYRFVLALFYGYESEDENAPFTREEMKELGMDGILPFFSVKPVDTRADEDAEEEEPKPAFVITGVSSVDTESGEITFDVMPVNIASAYFAANGLKPKNNVEFRANGIPGVLDGWHIWGTDHEDRGYVGYGEDFTWSVPTWNYEDLKAFEARQAFAAQLRLYHWQDYDSYEDYDWENCDWDRYYEDWDYYPDIITYFIDYENELASPYNVLYPGVTRVDILDEPYKPDYDEEGKPKKDEDGYAVLVPAMEEHQFLPYSSLREGTETIPPFVGEPKDQDPKGYRVILDESIPAVIVDGSDPMTFEDAAKKYGIILPDYEITFDGFEYSDGADEENFVETTTVYAEIEMNPEKTPAQRKLAIGDVITGTYSYDTFFGDVKFGTVKGWGDVTITPALAEVKVDATIIWTWDEDADVDHNLFYAGRTDVEFAKDDEGNIIEVYSRDAYELNIDEEDSAYLEDNLDITLDNFSHAIPSSVLVSFIDPETEEEVELEYDPATGKPVDPDAVGPTFDNIAIVDGKLVADITDFAWDMVYTIVAVYNLEDLADVTVTATITTIDRNREKVVLPTLEYTFEINGEDFQVKDPIEDSWYKWESDPQHKPIFKAFVDEGVINVAGQTDFKFDAEQDAFNEGELEGHLRMADPSGTAKGYVDFNRDEIVLKTLETFTAEYLKSINSGVQDEDDPYVFKGNVITRNVTTYIGEEVEIPMIFNYRVPAYDFLHQGNYTFDDGKWYTMASPKYDYNKQSLKKYDVHYMNVPALAFNIIDENDRFFNYLDTPIDPEDETYFYDKNLIINFWYTGDEIVDETPLEEQSATDELTTYGDLWFDASLGKQDPYNVKEGDNFKHTVFYYRSTADAIPMYGTLEIMSGGVSFEIPTSFEKDNGGKYLAKQDYSNYELRAWKPFYVPTYEQTITIDLDEHQFYTANVLEGLQFFDGRQVAASTAVDEVKDPFVEGTYSIEAFNNGTKSYFRPMLGFNDLNANNSSPAELVWGWIVGNCNQDGTSAVEGAAANGYADGVTSWEAYDLQTKSFVFSTDGVPKELRRLVDVNTQNYVMSFDYTSQLEFKETAEVSFAFDLQSPWQKFEKPFSVKVVIRGLDAQ